MFEIKILKQFEDMEKKKEVTNLMRHFSRKNKKSEKDVWTLTFEKREDFVGAIAIISSKISEFKTADVLYEFCLEQKMNNEDSQRFIESFLLFHNDFLSYVINITAINLEFYLSSNTILNIESFLFFNMSHLKKELSAKLADPETLDAVYGLMESSVLDKITILQTVVEALEIIDNQNIKIEPIKDFKVYCKDGSLKCISEKKLEIDRNFFYQKYGIDLGDDFDDLEVLAVIIGVISPGRVILFSSLSDDYKEDLIGFIKSFVPVCGEIKIFNADDAQPR